MDWWHARGLEHGVAIVMPDGGELELPSRIAQRFAAAVWQQMTLTERADAAEFVQRSMAERQSQFEGRGATHEALSALGLTETPPPRPNIVDLSQAVGDPAEGEPLPDAWALPVRAVDVPDSVLDDYAGTHEALTSSRREREEEAQRLHQKCLTRWTHLTTGQLRNYRQHDWRAHL